MGAWVDSRVESKQRVDGQGAAWGCIGAKFGVRQCKIHGWMGCHEGWTAGQLAATAWHWQSGHGHWQQAEWLAVKHFTVET